MAGRFKPLDVEREPKLGKHADGDGLYLIFAGATSKTGPIGTGSKAKNAGTD